MKLDDIEAFDTYIRPLQEIGILSTGNSSYTAMLARNLAQTGKPVTELTIAEALRICEATGQQYHQIYS